MIRKVGMIALGCAKNRVDAEVLLAMLEKAGYEICADTADCDAIIVHTCTFIEAANTESIDAILDAAAYKASGKLQKLIVTGCMAERYKSDIMKAFPEVDACLGSKSFDMICRALRSEDRFEYYKPLDRPCPEGDRLLTSAPYSVYVKIADGCSNHCSYCIIPFVRGEFMPRRAQDILDEVKTLVRGGAREINLVAQDTTKFPRLCDLIRDICMIGDVKWVRVLYCRPEGISDELLELMAAEPKFVPYIDVPLQHASGRILQLMNRSGDDKSLLDMIGHIRRKVPDVSLRTTFITGFPKETDDDFEILSRFIADARFDNLGVFPYSREEGTSASKMAGQVPEQVGRHRADIIMARQLTLLQSINSARIGKVYEILCEGSEDGMYTGRAYFQAPDVDGRVYFTSQRKVSEGEFVNVLIEKHRDYDLYGREV